MSPKMQIIGFGSHGHVPKSRNHANGGFSSSAIMISLIQNVHLPSMLEPIRLGMLEHACLHTFEKGRPTYVEAADAASLCVWATGCFQARVFHHVQTSWFQRVGEARAGCQDMDQLIINRLIN